MPTGKLNRLAFAVLAFAFATNMLLLPLPARAQDEGGDGEQLKFIRDAEIENYMHELAAPIERVAGLDPHSVTFTIIESPTVNSFVAGGQHEFFYTGLLQLTASPEELAGVIAHETGHIAEAIIGMILGAAAAAAAGNGQAAAGIFTGSQQIAERNYLTFSRSVEASADAAGMSFLDKAGISTHGMLDFFEKLEGQELLPQDRQMEYVQTHPLTQDRIDAVRYHWEHSPPALRNAKLPEKFYIMHRRMEAKLLGYLQPQEALLRYTDKDPRIPARYALAIALYRTNQTDHAIKVTDGLIKDEPNNPFFYELKAQIQFENGRTEQSIGNYKKANDLLPDSSLLRQAYGHALLESHDPADLDLAIRQLIEANQLEAHDPLTWHLLAVAWGRKGELGGTVQPYDGMVQYALAEESIARGNDKAAGQLAGRAMRALPKGSPYWLRAQDIKLTTAPEGDRDSGRHK